MLPAWFERLHFACSGFGAITVVVVGDQANDKETFTVLRKEANRWGFLLSVVDVPENLGEYQRDWSLERYAHMAMLRNKLLERVRDLKPDLFWSVDSDILVAELALKGAIEGLERFDAVGSKTYMTPDGTWCPSFGMLNGGGLNRWEDTGCFPVDVIMALKLMTPKAYYINYSTHDQGEDIGWSVNATNFGVKLGWDGSTSSKHVMSKPALGVIDERCGF
jgi:hypothetical protein